MELVRLPKRRLIIEGDDEELEQELGLRESEGRNWRGFHHHAALRIAGEDCQQTGHGTPSWGSQIERLCQGNGAHAQMIEFLKSRQQVRQ